MALYTCIMKRKTAMLDLGIILLSFTLWKGAECNGGAVEMKALHEKLFEDYNRLVRPSRNYSTPIGVNIQLYVSVILGLDTKRQLMFLRAFLRISWTDELLQWDSSQNGGIDRIVIPQDNIWKPDLILFNAANENDKLGSDVVNVAVISNGLVRWEPPLYLESTCKLDMSNYPFDVSVCPVNIFLWMDDNTTATLQVSESPISMRDMLVNGEYEISSAGATKNISQFEELFFETVTFNIRLARRPAYVAISLLIPVILLSVLSILSFIMPPDEPEKVNIAVTILLSFTVFLTFIDNSIPPNSDTISLLVIFIALLLLMSFLSVVGNILVVTTERWNEQNAQKDRRWLCSNAKNTRQPFTAELICSCIDAQDLTEGHKCESFQPGGVEQRTFVSDPRKGTNKASRSLASQLNRAFFITSCIVFVFISMLMFALISI